MTIFMSFDEQNLSKEVQPIKIFLLNIVFKTLEYSLKNLMTKFVNEWRLRQILVQKVVRFLLGFFQSRLESEFGLKTMGPEQQKKIKDFCKLGFVGIWSIKPSFLVPLMNVFMHCIEIRKYILCKSCLNNPAKQTHFLMQPKI